MDEDTCLADLLALNLHDYEDEVRGIVDKATKELGMEKVLGELDVTWSSMEFEYETHQRTHISLLKSSEELIETLEDNQVGLEPCGTRLAVISIHLTMDYYKSRVLIGFSAIDYS